MNYLDQIEVTKKLQHALRKKGWVRSHKDDAPGVECWTHPEREQLCAIVDGWACIHEKADPGGSDAQDWEDEWAEVPREIPIDQLVDQVTNDQPFMWDPTK